MWGEFLLFKFPKKNKDAKRNISLHYKSSLNIIPLDPMPYYVQHAKMEKMDGRHKTTGTIKKRRLEAPKCAQPLSVRNNFSWGVSLCFNIQFFSVGKLHTLRQQEGAGKWSINWWYMLTVNWEKRTCKIILLTILKNNLQVQDSKTWISKTECGQS